MENIDVTKKTDTAINVEVYTEGHHFAKYIWVAVGMIILAIVLFFGSQYTKTSDINFNIPTDTSHVIIFDNNSLYAFDPSREELKKLGTFDVENIKEVAISSNLASVALASESEVFVFESYKEGGLVVSSEEKIRNLSISDHTVLFSTGESNDKKQKNIYITDGDGAKIFALGTTPIFLDNGSKALAGTNWGFRVFDFEAKDVVDTETPQIPLASTMKTSKNGSKIALVSTNDSVHVYDIVSTRPINLIEDFFLVAPGVYDSAVSDEGVIAYLRPMSQTVFLSVYDSKSQKSINSELLLSPKARMLIWSK